MRRQGMSEGHKWRKGARVRTGFRPSSVHQHPERPVKPGARDLFPVQRARLLTSRPELPAVPHRYWKDAKGRPVMIRQFGAPTFRNVIEGGVLR